MASDTPKESFQERNINTGGGNYNERIEGNYIQGDYYVVAQKDLEPRRLQVLVHCALFIGSVQQYYFINLTNLSENREIEVTHIWLESEPELYILNPRRRLPKRLKPDESWETWIEVERIPEFIRNNPYNLFRVKLTSGEIIKSAQNKNVPKMGSVPGG
jgi:hypothetical protein